MNIWSAILFIPLFTVSSTSTLIASDGAKPSHQDLLVLKLVKDVQDHILYIQILKNNNPELRELLLSNLSARVFDTSHHLAEINNPEVIKLACAASSRLQGDFQKITGNCKNDVYYELCREIYLWSRMCMTKQ